jgi:hypothetical protein
MAARVALVSLGPSGYWLVRSNHEDTKTPRSNTKELYELFVPGAAPGLISPAAATPFPGVRQAIYSGR